MVKIDKLSLEQRTKLVSVLMEHGKVLTTTVGSDHVYTISEFAYSVLCQVGLETVDGSQNPVKLARAGTNRTIMRSVIVYTFQVSDINLLAAAMGVTFDELVSLDKLKPKRS